MLSIFLRHTTTGFVAIALIDTNSNRATTSKMFGRIAAQGLRTVARPVRSFGHATFEPTEFKPAVIGGLLIGIVVVGIGAVKFSFDHQQRKQGFYKNPIGYTP